MKPACPFCGSPLLITDAGGPFTPTSKDGWKSLPEGDEETDFYCPHQVSVSHGGRPHQWPHYQRRSVVGVMPDSKKVWRFYWAIIPPFKVELGEKAVKLKRIIFQDGGNHINFETIHSSYIPTYEEFLKMCERAKRLALFS